MNATLSDEDLVRALRARADGALPTMSLDPGETVVAGRRHRRRRAVAGSVSVAAAIALVTGVAVGAIPLPDRAPVATQAPRTLGSDTSVEVAHNVWATNVPVPRTAPDGPWLDLGLSVDVRAPGRSTNAAFPVGVAPLPGGAAGVTVAARDGFDGGDGSSLGTAATVTWGGPESLVRGLYPAPQRVPFSTPASSVTGDEYSYTAVVLVGAVPSWLAHPRVFLTYPAGITDNDEFPIVGQKTFEVPTFRAPGTSGTLLYAVRENISEASFIEEGLSPRPFAMFVGADGTTVAGEGCGRLDMCDLSGDRVIARVEP